VLRHRGKMVAMCSLPRQVLVFLMTDDFVNRETVDGQTSHTKGRELEDGRGPGRAQVQESKGMGSVCVCVCLSV